MTYSEGIPTMDARTRPGLIGFLQELDAAPWMADLLELLEAM